MKESVCLFPGSFDPVTNGHMDVIRRAAKIFDRVVVGVLHNPDKQGLFSVEQRVAMLKKACADIPQAEVIAYGGLLADLTREKNIRVVFNASDDTFTIASLWPGDSATVGVAAIASGTKIGMQLEYVDF